MNRSETEVVKTSQLTSWRIDCETLNNIGEVLTIFNLVMMGIGGIGGVAYLLNKRLRLGQRWPEADYLFVPPFFLAPSFLFMFAYR